MPGLIGLVGQRATPVAASTAAGSIEHFDDYCSQHTSPLQHAWIAQVWRHRKEVAGSWSHDDASGVSIFVNGTVIVPGLLPKRMRSSDLLAAYLNDNLAPEKYDGSFVIAVADPRTQQLVVYNDRLGILPFYYFAGPGCFCFAPEAKAIFSALCMTPEYSTIGLVSFLALGYCLADTTLFTSIHFLEPGSMLVIDVPASTYKLSRYWRMRFDPSPQLRSRRRAGEAMRDAILAGHQSVFADSDESFDLLLSGGWDSRGMLAAAHALGRMPRRSLSWGLRDDQPLSDPHLAAQLARRYKLDHRFIRCETDTFIENAVQWSYLTELNTDNFGWYGEGTHVLLNEYAGPVDFVLVGDECWGLGKHVRDQVEAMAACFMAAPLQNPLGECLAPELRAECTDIYLAEVQKVLQGCENTDLDDQKDFLYLHGRLPRFIFALGYYKELVVEVRRPFLCTGVLDLMQKIPARLRYGKNLYISTLIRFFPDLLKVGQQSGNSLPVWQRDLREKPALSQYFASLLSTQTLSRTSFGQHLDVSAIDRIAKAFFSESRTDPPGGAPYRTSHGALVQSLKQRLTAYDDVRLACHLRKVKTTALSHFDLLRRIALLTLLDQHFARFSQPLPRAG